MEALTAVQVGLLTIYDMLKAVDRGMVMTTFTCRKKVVGNPVTGYRKNKAVSVTAPGFTGEKP